MRFCHPVPPMMMPIPHMKTPMGPQPMHAHMMPPRLPHHMAPLPIQSHLAYIAHLDQQIAKKSQQYNAFAKANKY